MRRPSLFHALVLVLICLVPVREFVLAQAPAEGASSPHDALTKRLAALSEHEQLDAHARAALDQARRALEAADRAAQRGEVEESERAARLTDAALTLAERLDALARERGLLRTARDRKAGLSARRKAAQEALEHERARLRELAPGAEAP